MPRAEPLEIGRVVRSQQDGLAVQYGAIDWQGGHGITDPRERLRIVAGRPGPKADLIAVFPGNDPIPVELDLMEPTGSGRWPVRQRRLARQDEAGRPGTGSDWSGNAPEHTGPPCNRLRSDCESRRRSCSPEVRFCTSVTDCPVAPRVKAAQRCA